MATRTAEFPSTAGAYPVARPLTLCHFTTAHRALKSRSFHRECLPLAGHGVEVRFLAPVEKPVNRDGIQVIPLARQGALKRLLLFPGLIATLLAQHATIYHLQDPQLLPAAFVLKLLFRRRVVYDAYEDFPSMAVQKPRIPRLFRPVVAEAIAIAEAAGARIFDGVITADSATLRRFARTGRSHKLVFYNFPNLDFFPTPAARAKSFDVVYRGGLSERAGTSVLLDATERLAAAGRPVRLLLVGYCDSRACESELRERIRLAGLEPHVEIRGRIDHENMASVLSEARVGVSPLLSTPKFLRNIPVKVFEYWACGMPVVATDLRPIRPFLRDGDAGLLVPPGNAADLARSIGWLLDHPEQAARMGAKGRELVVTRFSNAGEVTRLRRFIAQIADAR